MFSPRVALFGLLSLSLLASACSDSSDEPSDASAPADATVRDTGPRDLGIHPDATVADLGNTPDAAPADTGVHPDASEPDAAEPDAAEEDAGLEPDAGMDADAGLDPDAGPPSGCELGQVSSTATTSNLDLFGTPAYFNGGAPVPAGTYRITYVDGCMKYGGGQGWTVNAYAANASCWYVVGASTSERIIVPPGTVGYTVGSGAYADFEDCVNASLQVPPVEFVLAQPTPLGVWLLDSPYSDNLAGIDNRNPTWRLSVVTSTCPP